MRPRNKRTPKPTFSGIACALIVLSGLALAPGAAADTHRIVFVKQRKSGDALWTMNANGHKPKFLHAPGDDPSISSDGKKVAFDAPCGKNRCIFSIRTDGTRLKRLIRFKSGHSFGGNPVWSPNGKRLAFDRYTETFNSDTDTYDTNPPDIYIAKGDGTGVVRITTNFDATQPTWSPNGKRIAATVADGNLISHIWTMNTTGGDRYQITFSSLGQTRPSWSPNRTEVAYLQPVSDSHRNEVWSSLAGGGFPRQITNIVGPSADGLTDLAWDPSGANIVIAGQVHDNAPSVIWKVKSDGSTPFGNHQLKPFGGKDTHSLLSPDR